MAARSSLTLSDIAQRLGVAQHRLIHLCEKGVVSPDLQDASGRGSTRVFSARNLLEFAVALRLRDMMLPLSTIRAITHVLRTFERRLEQELPGFSLPGSLRDEEAPDLRIILSDGRSIFFSLGQVGHRAKLFGGIPLHDTDAGDNRRYRMLTVRSPNAKNADDVTFGGPEQSRFARLELSVTQVARDLPLE